MGFGKDGKGQILYDEASVALGTLAADTAAVHAGGYSGNLVEDFRIMRMDYYVHWASAAAADTALLVGVCSGDLTGAEIKETLESRPLNRSSATELEESNRAVWILGLLTSDDAQSSVGRGTLQGSINLRWTFSNPTAWSYWAYNPASGALTTGSTLWRFFKIYGVWVS